MAKPRNFTKRTRPNFSERVLAPGLTGARGHQQAEDYFTNLAARMGFGAPSLFEGSNYELIRFSYDYWQLITLYRNHWISRRVVDTPAIDMVRAWPRITSDLEPDDIARIERSVRRTRTKMAVQTAIIWARLFGGAGALIVIDGQEHDLDQPLKLDSVPLGGYKGLIPFDRWAGINPEGEVCHDPSRPLDFNKPEYYHVTPQGGNAFKVHSSRILRFLGPEVPTPEREAQTWWGISVLEPIYEDIKKYDNMSWNILMLTYRANILGMKFDDLAQLLSGLGSSQKASQGFERRMSAINHLMSNQSLVPLPKDGGIESTQYSFAGLDTIFQLFQLAISGGSQIPVSRLWGRTYSGLGAPEDIDEKMYEEKVSADQSTGLLPQLEELYPVICMSELGEVPEELDLNCPSIRVMDEKEKAELASTVVNTATVALNSGGISKRTYAKELKQSSDKTGIFSNITSEFIQSLPDTVQDEGEMADPFAAAAGECGGEESSGFGEEEGAPNLTPASSPQKVLREEGREKKEQERNSKQVQRDAVLSGQLWRVNHDLRQLAADARSWVGFDLDGTLAEYDGYKGARHIGAPIKDGVAWAALMEVLRRGGVAKIFTARVADDPDGVARRAVDSWVRRHIGQSLPITCVKDAGMTRLYDDRAVACDADGAGPERVIHGLKVVIETPKGFSRHGVTPQGEPWQNWMPADYGYIKGQPGSDGDSLDCYVGPDPLSNWFYVVDQSRVDNRRVFDESKCMIGFPSQDAALRAYDKGHHRSKDIFLDFTPMRVQDFKAWLDDRDPKKPCSPMVTAR